MRESLSALCSSFIENRDIIKASFGWESAYLYPVCAAVFTDKGQLADEASLKRCQAVLKDNTGFFSSFRSTVKLVMISMMAVDREPEERLQKTLQVYDGLREHFFISDYLPVASMMIADLAEPARYGEIAARTRHIYELMKKEHPFLTSGEDSVFAALLALSNLSDEQIAAETEECYELLKAEFFSGNAVQSLSHVLALGDGPAADKCHKAMELYHSLKNQGYKYGTSYELATLGVLAMLPADTVSIVTDVMEADDFLAGQKGYGLFGIGSRQRLMHAGMLVSSDYMGQTNHMAMHSAAIGSTVSLIAAQQAAMCAAIAASNSGS